MKFKVRESYGFAGTDSEYEIDLTISESRTKEEYDKIISDITQNIWENMCEKLSLSIVPKDWE